MLQIRQFVADVAEFLIKKGCCQMLQSLYDPQPTKQCECVVAGLQSVANDAEASTKKKRKVANTAELSKCCRNNKCLKYVHEVQKICRAYHAKELSAWTLQD